MKTILQQKKELRELMLSKRNACIGEEKQRADENLQKQLLESELYKKAKTVCFYVSLPREPDTQRIITLELANNQKNIIVPSIVNNRMLLFQITSLSTLHEGTLGVLEPRIDHEKEIDPQTIDCWIIPGVAFDMQGNRLGRGKGYYDSVLKITNGIKIGYCYSFQVIPIVPTESYDQKVDYILTDTYLLPTCR